MFFALLCVAATPAWAISGNELKPDCDKPDKSAGALYCLAYMTGVIDTIEGLDSVLPKHELCASANVTPAQLLAMLRKYLADHPERLHYLASSLIEDMYAESFGCNKSP
jgi:hypothetical protein